jgi:LysR family glycine cleavage system transcriptional activator
MAQNAGHAEIDCERGLQINDSAAVIQAAIAGSGVALGRTTLVATDLAEGRLVRPFGDDLAYDFAYYIVHRPQADKAPAVAAFKTWLLEEASEKS